MHRVILSIAGTWDEEGVTDSNSLQQIVDDPRRCLFCGVFGDKKPSVISLKYTQVQTAE